MPSLAVTLENSPSFRFHWTFSTVQVLSKYQICFQWKKTPKVISKLMLMSICLSCPVPFSLTILNFSPFLFSKIKKQKSVCEGAEWEGREFSFPSQCYSSPGFLSWAPSAVSWKRCRSVVGIFGDMVLIIVDQRDQAVPQCCIQWGEGEENRGHQILACFRLARLSL